MSSNLDIKTPSGKRYSVENICMNCLKRSKSDIKTEVCSNCGSGITKQFIPLCDPFILLEDLATVETNNPGIVWKTPRLDKKDMQLVLRHQNNNSVKAQLAKTLGVKYGFPKGVEIGISPEGDVFEFKAQFGQ